MKCYANSLETNYFIMLKIPYMLKAKENEALSEW
jgi:hypothetical protein